MDDKEVYNLIDEELNRRLKKMAGDLKLYSNDQVFTLLQAVQIIRELHNKVGR